MHTVNVLWNGLRIDIPHLYSSICTACPADESRQGKPNAVVEGRYLYHSQALERGIRTPDSKGLHR